MGFTGFTGSMDVLLVDAVRPLTALPSMLRKRKLLRSVALSDAARVRRPDVADSDDLHTLMRMLYCKVSWPRQVCTQVHPYG